MLKIAYVLPKKQIEKNFAGVNKKIEMQIRAFLHNNIDVKIIDTSIDDKSIIEKVKRRLPYGNVGGDWIKLKNIKDIDAIYIRYITSDYRFIEALRYIKNNSKNVKIIIEIPTYPYEREKKLTIGNLPIVIKDLHNRRKLYKYIDYIATYSQDKTIFGIETINICNGIDFDSIQQKNTNIITKDNEEINIIAVATFAKWHGYDRFIEGIKNYYENGGSRNIKLHLVGDGDEVENYKKIVNLYDLNKNIIFYGKKLGHELDKIYDMCDLGLDAMGRHRSGVYFNSSIKGKEYLAKGLPIISGVETELDKDNFKYYYRVPADDSSINIEDIIEFYEKTYPIGTLKKSIQTKIRNYGISKFDMSICIKPIIDKFKY